MPTYKAPLREMRFLINEVFDYPAHYAGLSNGGEATPDVVDAILEGIAVLCEKVLAPINLSGDKEGCRFKAGEVSTPTGFKEAYRQFVEGGCCKGFHSRSNTVVRGCRRRSACSRPR
jgi:hypothetical protein